MQLCCHISKIQVSHLSPLQAMSLFDFIDQPLDNSQPVGDMPLIQDSKKQSIIITLEAYREEHPARQRENSSRKGKKTKPEKLYFLAALPWIREHLQELQETGWTRASLFRRGKYTWPYGLWGVAWLSPWRKDNVQVDIDNRYGAIRFTFNATDGRIITQSAYPPVQGVRHKNY